MSQTLSNNTPRRRNEDDAPLEPMETPVSTTKKLPPFEDVLLEFIELDLDDRDDELTLMKDHYATRINALAAGSSAPVATSSNAIASIQKMAQRREARALELQSLLTQNMQSSQPASPWFPSANAILQFQTMNSNGYVHGRTLINDIQEKSVKAHVGISSEAEAMIDNSDAMSSEAIASIMETEERRYARASALQALFTQNTQSSQSASPWVLSEKALLAFIEMDLNGYKYEQTLIEDIHAIALNAFVAIHSNVIEALGTLSSEAIDALGPMSSKVVAIFHEAIAAIQEAAQRRETRALELQSLLTQNTQSAHAANDAQQQSE